MTQVYIVSATIVLVIALICYVFIRQTITKRQKEKQRLRRALDKRVKELTQMLGSFPAGFLPRDVQVFLYRCIVDVFEQLSKLAPGESEYIEQFQLYTSHMEATMRAADAHRDVVMQSTKQINEIRQYLNYLGRFIQKWGERGNISSKQYAHYKALLKKLINQLMVDNYILLAKQSTQTAKPKLAVHYLNLAKNLLLKEGLAVAKQSRIDFVDSELRGLKTKIEAEEGSQHLSASDAATSQDEQGKWQQFTEQEADWKKKNVYD